jgi:hypothetical protein
VTLAATRNAISGWVVQRHRVPIYQYHSLSLTGSRRDMRWVSDGGKTPTFCVFPVFGVIVTEKCWDASGDGEYSFRSGCSAPECAVE